jgi:iron complex outermembrane receptor protein
MCALTSNSKNCLTLVIVFSGLLGWAQAPQDPDLSTVSLEDLMNIQVTSVSKKEQKLSKTGAAAFVITQDDIRRSGATNIPDLLRLAPGVDVAQVDATGGPSASEGSAISMPIRCWC